MEAGLDNANATNNPFTNSNGSEILAQKDALLHYHLNDGFKPNGAGEEFFLDMSSNGKRTSTEEFDDDEDMGPETDVDAVDDVLLSPTKIAAEQSVNNNAFGAALAEKIVAETETKHEADLMEGEKTPREETPTPPVDEAHDVGLVDNVAESGEDSEDEWNYYKGDTADKENVSPSQPDLEVAAIIGGGSEKTTEEEEEENMSQLNPDAAEFVPVSPTRVVDSPACRALKDDTVLAQSPVRGLPNCELDIDLPNPMDFQKEVKNRPSGVFSNGHENEIMENLLNGKNIEEIEFQPNSSPSKGSATDEFHFGPNATPFSTPGKFLDQTDTLSTKANFGDESTTSYLEKSLDTSSFAENNPFGEQGDIPDFQGFKKEQDPMSMSFYQDKEDAGDPFDLNKVQVLPENVDDFIGKRETFDDTISDLPEHLPMENANLLTTDLDRQDDLLGVCELPKSPIPATPEPTLTENLCAIKTPEPPTLSPEPVHSESEEVCAKCPQPDDFSIHQEELQSNVMTPSPQPLEQITDSILEACMNPVKTTEILLKPSSDDFEMFAKSPEPDVIVKSPEPVMSVGTPEPLEDLSDLKYSASSPIPDVCAKSPLPDVSAQSPVLVATSAKSPEPEITSPEPEICAKSPDFTYEATPISQDANSPEPVVSHEQIGSPQPLINENTFAPLECSLPPFCLPPFIANEEQEQVKLQCSLPLEALPVLVEGEHPDSPHEDVTSSVKDDEPLSPFDAEVPIHMDQQSFEPFEPQLSSRQELENVGGSKHQEVNIDECTYPVPQFPEVAHEISDSLSPQELPLVETKIDSDTVKVPEDGSSVIEATAAATATVLLASAASATTTVVTSDKADDKKAPAKPKTSSTSTKKPTTKTTTTLPPKSSPKPPPISKMSARPLAPAKLASTTKAAPAKTTGLSPKPSTTTKAPVPKPKAPLAAKTSIEKKPMANGDGTVPKTGVAARKPAVPSAVTKAQPIPKTSATKVSSAKPIVDKVASARTVAATKPTSTSTLKSSTAATAPKPRPNTLATKSATGKTTTSTTTKVSSTLKVTSSPRTAPAPAARPKPAPVPMATKPRVPLTKTTAKAPDAEKQNKENVNKLTASRTNTASKTTTTLGSTTNRTTTVRKTDVKPLAAPKSIIKTTTSTRTMKKSNDLTKNGPTKTTKTTTTKIMKPKENGVPNGVTTMTEITTVNITSNDIDEQLIKDLSPIENNLIIDNSQLPETVAD